MKERIAHFADNDTRRAMGFGPRKLVVPDLKIRVPRQNPVLPYIFDVDFDDPEIRVYFWVDAPNNYNAVHWVFNRAYYAYKKSDLWNV